MGYDTIRYYILILTNFVFANIARKTAPPSPCTFRLFSCALLNYKYRNCVRVLLCKHYTKKTIFLSPSIHKSAINAAPPIWDYFSQTTQYYFRPPYPYGRARILICVEFNYCQLKIHFCRAKKNCFLTAVCLNISV